MDLKNYTCEDSSTYDGITFMENAETKHRVVLKRADMEHGISEIRAYQRMCGSPLIDYAVDRDGVIMMLHRYDGENLADMLLDKRKKMLLNENLGMVLSSALICLKKLHGAGICHGGITPEKLIIDEDYSVKMVGYGSASDLENPVFGEKHSKFSAPEAVFGGKADARLTDYYSLGRTLSEIYSGEENSQCADYDAVEKIACLSSVIPSNREI